MARRRDSFSQREVFSSLAVLTGTSVALYTALWFADFGLGGPTPWALFTDPDTVSTLANLGEVTVGTLGVALTVITIIVELASNRYTPRITELFIRDPVNGLMMGFFVVTALLVLWADMSMYGDHWPKWMAITAVAAMSTSLLLLLPYFAYVFDFLLPTRVVNRIQQTSANAIDRVTRRGVPAIDGARQEVLQAIEQLGEIALNSVDSKDKGITIASLNALTDLAEANQSFKRQLPAAWFDPSVLVETDQDFIAMHPDVVHALEARRTWVEMKVLRQFQHVFEESLIKMRDICHFIAIQTRKLAVTAASADDGEALALYVRFLNTYMRAALNARDQKSAYNLMNEYRLLAEALVSQKRTADVLLISERLKFYGQLAFKMKLPFILETVAYDMCTLLERAADEPCEDALLTVFLDVDRAAEDDQAQEASLRGVRKAQVKLATWYLAQGRNALAKRIHDDMRTEPRARLEAIHRELRSVVDAEFWEVSDRGVNFEYLPPERREKLDAFFASFYRDDPA
jgi:hypothetical protein